MNTKLIRETIAANADSLPEEFISGTLYNPRSQTYCIWGWLAKISGNDPAKSPYWNEEVREGELVSDNVIEWLEAHFDLKQYPIWTGRADKLIEENMTRVVDINRYGDARLALAAFLVELDDIAAADEVI